MKKIIKILLCSILLCASIVVFTLILNAEFENTHVNTGNSAEDIIAVAITQLGYKEGSLEGTVQKYDDCTKYGEWYGMNYNAWCAMFVSWCADQAEISTSVIPKHASCDVGMQWFLKRNQFTYGSYYGGTDNPKRGDIIYFGLQTSSGTFDSNHVGIVYKVEGGNVYVYEGNSSAKVQSVTYKLGTSYILGFATPDYSGNLPAPSYETGKYLVDTAKLNFRSEPTSSSTSYGLLSKGTLLVITEVQNGWGKASYDGKTGWVSLEYCQFVYEVRYDANGGTNAPSAQYKVPYLNLTVTSSVPVKEGYVFSGWSSTPNGSVEYKSGSSYNKNSDIVLYAAWVEGEVQTYTVTYNANGGVSAPAAQTKEKGKELTLSADKPLREGYTFLGWATESGGSSVYQPGAKYTEDKDITLYAVWKKNEVLPELTIVCGAGGKAEKSLSGDMAIVKLTADKGYAISYIAVNSEPIPLMGDISGYTLTLDASQIKKVEVKFVYNDKLWINPFSDVKDTEWYYEAVKFCYSEKIMMGVSSSRYAPSKTLTRAEFVTILGRLYEKQGGVIACNGTLPFTDAPQNSYYYTYLCWAYNNKVVSGTSTTTFSPDSNLTREQICVMLYNYESFIKGSAPAYNESVLASFADSNTVSSWAKNAVSWTVGNEILSGANGKLMPKDTATRAQAATIIMKYCSK